MSRRLWLSGWGFSRAVWDVLPAPPPARDCFDDTGVDSVAALHARVRSQLPEPALLVGWSSGAMLALETAAALPQLVSGVVAFAASPQFCRRDRRLGWPLPILRRMQARLQRQPAAVLADFAAGIDDLGEAQRAAALRNAASCMAELAAGLEYLTAIDLTAALGRLRCPVLWIHGRRDQICPVAAVQALAGAVASDRFRFEFWEAGHAPFAGDPRRAAAAIDGFAAALSLPGTEVGRCAVQQ